MRSCSACSSPSLRVRCSITAARTVMRRSRRSPSSKRKRFRLKKESRRQRSAKHARQNVLPKRREEKSVRLASKSSRRAWNAQTREPIHGTAIPRKRSSQEVSTSSRSSGTVGTRRFAATSFTTIQCTKAACAAGSSATTSPSRQTASDALGRSRKKSAATISTRMSSF